MFFFYKGIDYKNIRESDGLKKWGRGRRRGVRPIEREEVQGRINEDCRDKTIDSTREYLPVCVCV